MRGLDPSPLDHLFDGRLGIQVGLAGHTIVRMLNARELVGTLQIHPELRTGAKRLPQSLGGFRRNRPLAVDNFTDQSWWPSQNLCQVRLRPLPCLQLLFNKFAWREDFGRYAFAHCPLLVIIFNADNHDHLVGGFSPKLYDETPLIIQAHRVLMAATAL